MYLQPYNYPHIRMAANHHDSRAASPTLQLQSSQLSHSQGNLLQLPAARSPSPHPLQTESKQRSHSLNTLSAQHPSQHEVRAPAYVTRTATPPVTSRPNPPPVITVEMDRDDEQRGRSMTMDSEGSLGTDSSDYSFSDDFSSSSASSTFNLSVNTNDDRLRLSRTPPPMANNRLSPTSGLEGKMAPSVSDPNLYKGPSTPKVPPRPQTQEILTRCTTITRKKMARGTPSPTQIEISNL